MKILIVTVCLLFSSLAFADTYEASMSGIECSGCKKKILRILGEMDGVESVRIKALKKKGQHQLVVETDGSIQITFEQAKEALKEASHYQITSWEKKEAKKDES